MKAILFLFILLFSLPVLADKDQPATVKQPTDAVDCQQLKQEILENLRRPATCWSDIECKTISWGCPWQMAPCHFSIYSTSEPERNAEMSIKVSKYDDICVNSNQKTNAECAKFYTKVEAIDCTVDLNLVCLNGACTTPIGVILQGGDIDPADIYGSREIIE